jgi:putative glycosyltransferase (TIGR04372 family)
MKRMGRLSKAVKEVVIFSNAFGKWILLTILNPWRLENIYQVLVEVTSLLKDAIARYEDPTLSLVRSANREIAKNNLTKAQLLYDEAIRSSPMKAETYFVRAKNFTYLNGNPSLVDQEITLGLNINKLIAEKVGLDILNLKILGDEFAGMGHLSLLDIPLKLKKMGIIEKNHIMVVSENSVANFAYLNCWRKHLPILITNAKNYSAIKSLLSPIYEDQSMFETRSGYLPLYEAWNLALNSWGDSAPLLELSLEQKEAGDKVLEKIGLPNGSWFVCLHVREGAKGGYLRSGADADISDYLPAIDSIIQRGAWVIRMGKGAKPPLKILPNLWDYANSEHQSDWMDVYLWASCRFFIGTSSGPLCVPPTFGRPVLYTNACSLGHMPNFKNSLMIPKLFWSNKKKSFLNFREIFEGQYGWTVRPEYDEGQTRLVSNSPAEIQAAVDEMINTLDHPELNINKTNNQEAFEKIREPFKSTSQMRIADSFVKLHYDLLE